MNIKKQEILNKTKNHCAYCGCKLKLEQMTIDHVIPKSNGGTKDIKNLMPCCPDCNNYKSSLGIKDFRKKINKAYRAIEKCLKDNAGEKLLMFKFRQMQFDVSYRNTGSVVFYFEKPYITGS